MFGDDYMCDDDEDYNLEYSEESSDESLDVDLENQYYKGKTLKAEDPREALALFQKVLELEAENKGEWGFKALKQIIKVSYILHNYEEMLNSYKKLLTYIKSAVTRYYSEKSINSILDYVSNSKDQELMENFYSLTLEGLKEIKNERIWFKTCTKMGTLFLERKQYGKLTNIIKDLHQSCKTENGEDDVKKGTQVLEVYALEIQMYTQQKKNKILKSLYEQSLRIKTAISHPITMGIIRECGGKMHLSEAQYAEAHSDFFEAFKNFDEAGSPRRIACLKYLILANMLMKSDINPFDSQEAKPYQNDPQLVAMTDMISAYQSNDIAQFEIILRKHRDKIMADNFIRENIEEVLRNLRTEVLVKLLRPYNNISLHFISNALNIDLEEVNMLVATCILDGFIDGKIDEISQMLYLNYKKPEEELYTGIKKWTDAVNKIQEAILEHLVDESSIL